jgi:nucleotide-binding universal stress UspA family protein
MDESRPSTRANILLAVDGSPSAKSAVFAATQIASRMDWSLHALYVVDASRVFEVYSDTTNELSELGEKLPHAQQIKLFEEQGLLALTEMEALCQKKGLSVTREMIFGGVPDIIRRIMTGYDLLAIGRRGNHRQNDTQHLGGNFKQVAHHTRIPMLIGGNGSQRPDFQRVLLAYDGSRSSRTALTWAEDFQRIFKDILILFVEKRREPGQMWLEERFEEISNSSLKHYDILKKEGMSGAMIASIASMTGVDLILMGTGQHTGPLAWGRDGLLDTVLREIDIPVLATK